IYDITSKTNGNELIPLYSDTQGSAKASYKPTCSCEQVEYFKNSEKIVEDYPNSYVNVISLSINNDKKAANRRTIVGNSDSVYASANNLYLASMTYGKVTDGEYNADTQLHKFNLKDDSSQYQTSANISGTLLNQYSMDEYKGNFRVAATKGSVTDTNTKSTNHIYVLDKDMKQIGSLDDLAPGEEIYSSRFVNDRVYLVTFKKVDPFFVIDLKDPTKPAVLGYLKIPGYSDYLHPYDENHIIGVGKEAIDASSQQISSRSLDFAWYQGLKMAIFDVTDVKAPKEMHKVVIGDRGTESPVLDDPKAFLFNKDKNLLVLPVSLYELTDAQKKSTKTTTNTYGKFTYQGAYVYNIDLTKGFTLKGRVTHASATPAKTLDHYDDSAYATEVRRTLYIGDNLYTISDSKIMANTLSNLDKTAEINLN
ncbi:MAG: beta-propeller domain-containing protein, partial [Candidatus Saccharibacteria bacterium]